MSNTFSEIVSAVIATLHGIILLPAVLTVLAFAIGLIGARYRWRGWRLLGGLVWLAAAITAEVLLVQAIFITVNFNRVGIFLLGGLVLIPISLSVALIERTIAARRLKVIQADSRVLLPTASLGVVIGLFIAIGSLLLPVITEPTLPAEAQPTPSVVPTDTPIPTITPVMPPTNTPHPTIPPTVTPLPTLTITPSETDIPTLIQPPTVTLTPTITLTPTVTPRFPARTAAPSRTSAPPPHQPTSE